MSRSFTIPALAALCASTLTSCDRDGDPGLKERVSLLQAEVAQRESSMKNLREEFQKEKAELSSESSGSSSSGGSSASIDPAKARQSYLTSVETLRGDLAKALGSDGVVERASVFPVSGPDPDYPISSKVAFTIAAKNGRRAEVVVPLVANASGEWKEASVDSIASDFRKSLAANPAPTAPVADNTGVAPPQPQPPPRTNPQGPKPLPTDVMGANRTVQVGWDDPAPTPTPTPAPRQPQPQVQQPVPTPQPPPRQPEKPATPTKVMPSTRDVIIDFDR